MQRKRVLFRNTLLLALVLSLGYSLYYIARALPILTGFGAKHLCSCHFVAHRPDSSILANELARFPYRLADYRVNESDSFATATIFGLMTRKAVYRSGAGCVLLVDEDNAPRIPQLASRPPLPPGFQLPRSTEAYSGVDYPQLHAALDWAFSEPDIEHPKNTKAVVVVYNDTLVAERYAPGFSSDMPMPGWSMTKSVINALIGISVQQARLSVDDPAPVPAWQGDDDPRHFITWNHLLRMSSGLAWDETYFGVSDVTRMLYLSADMASVAIHQPLKARPGREWYYSSGTTNILSFLLRQQWGDDAYYSLPYEKLFRPLGMSSAVMEADLSGTFVGSSYMLATARDWAKFGLLYYHDGVWQGERILPEGWVKYTTRPVDDAPFRKYGAQFWLNAGERGRPDRREFSDVPTELFFAQGFDEQSVFIFPTRKLIIVRLGITSRGDFDKNFFLAEVLKAFPGRN